MICSTMLFVLVRCFSLHRSLHCGCSIYRPRPDPYTQPGYQFEELRVKGLPGNTPGVPKMTKPLKTDQVNKPKAGKLTGAWYCIPFSIVL